MSRNYVRKTEKIDPERGDTLTLKKKEVEQFFAPGYPVKVRHALFDAFLGWFAGGDKPHLDDPVVNGILQTLIKTQVENVRNYLDKCETNRGNVLSRNRGTIVPLVSPGGTVVPTHNSNSRNKHGQTQDMFVSTVGNGHTRADAASDVPLTVDEAVKEVCIIAPPINAKHYAKDDLEFYRECKEDGTFENADSMIEYALETIDEKDNAITKNALKKAVSELGEDVSQRAIFRFSTELYKEQDKNGSTDAKNAPPDSIAAAPGKHFMARLKRLKAAIEATATSSGGSRG